MSNIKISQLPAATTTDGTELVPIVQASTTKKATIDVLLTPLSETNGSSLVGYLPAGVDAVPTTVQAKLRETVSVLDFGVTGNGVTDDYAKLQAAIDATPVGATLKFDGRPYWISRRLDVTKSINIDFANSKLILAPSNNPLNHHLDIYSLRGTNNTFTQTIALGDYVFNVTAPDLAVGDYVAVNLGTDPYDPNEQHWVRICRVTANSGSTVSIDHRVPYNIAGTSHTIRKITSLVANCTFKNLVLDYASNDITDIPDTHIYPSYCFNVVFENIQADKVRILFNAFKCHNMTFRNIQCTAVKAGYGSHGRVLTAWQMESSVLENINATCKDGSGGLFFESWCRNIDIRNLSISSFGTPPDNGGAQITGGSYDIRFDGVVADLGSSGQVFTTGAQPGDYVARNVRLLAFPKFLSLRNVVSFVDVQNGISIREGLNNICTERIQIAMQPGWTDVRRTFVRGLVKRVWAWVEDKTHLSQVYILAGGTTGPQFAPTLVNNQWVELSNVTNYGSDYPFNDPSKMDKQLAFYTGAGMVPGTVLTVVAEYWPIIGTNAYLFPPRASI